MNDRIRIHNWDTHQTYRRDRNQPPWIKVHRNLFLNPKWIQLSDAQKGHLISLWILAANKDGWIPSDPAILKKLCNLDSRPDVEMFKSLGFIEHDARTTPERRQHDATESESESESESKADKKQIGASAKTDALVVLGFLNKTTGKRFSNSKNIESCLKREKCTVDECRAVIRFKWGEWHGTDMEKHINATTPFRASHFRNYLDESKAGPGGKVSGHVSQIIGPDGNPMAQWEIDMDRDFEEMDRRKDEQVPG